jgi:hypothetical protein
MGFFKTFGNILQGKPVFETPKQPEQIQSSPVAGGPKVVPQAYIERVECRENGRELDCDAIIQNYSNERLELDKVEILGKTQYLNTFIDPGQEYELQLFDDTRPNNTNQNQCNIYYKNAAGDYFCSVHTIEFKQLPDNTYSINYIKFQSPVRDV